MRTITELNLVEISLVEHPVYPWCRVLAIGGVVLDTATEDA